MLRLISLSWIHSEWLHCVFQMWITEYKLVNVSDKNSNLILVFCTDFLVSPSLWWTLLLSSSRMTCFLSIYVFYIDIYRKVYICFLNSAHHKVFLFLHLIYFTQHISWRSIYVVNGEFHFLRIAGRILMCLYRTSFIIDQFMVP